MPEFLGTAENRKLAKCVDAGRVPLHPKRLGPVLKGTELSPWKSEFLRTLKAATDDSTWCMRHAPNGAIALGQITRRGWATWYCGRSGAFNSSLIRWAQIHHYRNKRKIMDELENTDAKRESDEANDVHDAAMQEGGHLYDRLHGKTTIQSGFG